MSGASSTLPPGSWLLPGHDMGEEASTSTRERLVLCEVCGRREEAGKTKIKLCQRCKCGSYCGKECQTEDWPTHKIK
eukprot:gene21143-28033_t